MRYLKCLDRIGAAHNTLRSYATVLKQCWEYLLQQLDWQQVTLDDLAQFVLWLTFPTGSLHVLPAHPVPQARSNRIINYALTALSSFYDYHWRIDAISTNMKEKTTTYLHPCARRVTLLNVYPHLEAQSVRSHSLFTHNEMRNSRKIRNH